MKMAADCESVANQLDMFLHDENRIVTYKWLSKQLNLSIQDAKNELKIYLDQNKTNGSKISATYCVIGGADDNGNNLRVIIVNENGLEKLKTKLNYIQSQHVYSLQKSVAKGSNALYMVDLEAKDRKHTMHVEQSSKLSKKPSDSLPAPLPPAFISSTNGTMNSTIQVKLENSRETNNKTNKTKRPRLGDLHDQNSQSNFEKTRPEQKEKTINSMKQTASEKKSMFFSNHCTKKSQEKVTSAVKMKEDKQEDKIHNTEPKSRLAKRSANSSKLRSNKNGRFKRARIESSSSDESDGNGEDKIPDGCDLEDPIVPFSSQTLDEEEPLANTSQMVSHQKMVSETFLDENGYMVTKKSIKIVEEVVPVEKPQKTKSKQPPSNGKTTSKVNNKKTAANNKQATLTSFFKRS